MDTQEELETSVPLEDVAPIVEVVGNSDKKDEEPPHEEQEAPEPPTPRIPKKRAQRPPPVVVAQQSPPIDHVFWSDMLVTKRELDREAKHSRYANLVKF
jgi:hypothetical protein